MAGREHKNERDEEEERSISPNPVEVKIVMMESCSIL